MCERRVVFFSFSSVSIQDKCVFVPKKSPFFGSKSYLSLLFGVNWALVWAKNPNKWFHNPMSISVLSLMQEDKNKIRPNSVKAIFTIVSPKLLNNIAYLCHCYGRFFPRYTREKTIQNPCSCWPFFYLGQYDRLFGVVLCCKSLTLSDLSHPYYMPIEMLLIFWMCLCMSVAQRWTRPVKINTPNKYNQWMQLCWFN